MKIRPVGGELFLCKLTDITKIIAAFRSFVNAPKNGANVELAHGVKNRLS